MKAPVHDAPPAASPPRAGCRLAALRERIASVRRARAGARLLAALATAVSAVVVALGAVFLLDWLLALPRAGRLLALGAAAGTLGWVWVRHVRPWLFVRESDLDLALLVERQQGLDGDLVAALQFESPAAAAWGSESLREAVVDYVAEFGRGWNVPRQVAGADLRRRLAWLVVTVGCGAAGIAIRPDFARAFLDRVLLGSTHYPTRTRIESLTIAGRPVDVTSGGRRAVASPLGESVTFEALVAGAVPEAGSVRLVSASGAGETTLDLAPAGPAEGGAAAGPAATRFVALVPRLTEPIDVQVYVGDAWTDTVRVDVVPPPIVETTLTVAQPAYARGGARAAAEPQRARHIVVPEGASVTIAVSSANKSLREVVLVAGNAEHPLRQTADGAWSLPAGASPLDAIREPVAFEVRVVDVDGLAPEKPLTGMIRIKPDAPPRITVETGTRIALPAGAPVLEWQTTDDHGVRSVTLVVEPFTGGAAGEPRPAEPRRITAAEIPAGGWVGAADLPLSGATPVPLGPLGLRKGDQVRVSVEVTDYRGESEGRTAVSDPIVIDVTDEPGLFAALAEDDERSADQLDTILERELEVGGAAGSSTPAGGRTPANPGGKP